jgi:hypothetical protein
MLQLTEQFSLIHYRIDTFFLYNSAFRHFFKGVCSFKFLSLEFPNFSEATFANDVVKLKMCFINRFNKTFKTMIYLHYPSSMGSTVKLQLPIFI